MAAEQGGEHLAAALGDDIGLLAGGRVEVDRGDVICEPVAVPAMLKRLGPRFLISATASASVFTGESAWTMRKFTSSTSLAM